VVQLIRPARAQPVAGGGRCLGGAAASTGSTAADARCLRPSASELLGDGLQFIDSVPTPGAYTSKCLCFVCSRELETKL
jgi:hypothetical protein